MMGLFSRKTEQASVQAEIVIEKENIQRINQIKKSFTDIEDMFSVYERIMFLRNGESVAELRSRIHLLEANALNLRGKMDEVQEIAAKIESRLLVSRKSDLENRDKHLATHEKEVLDYVYQIDKIIDRLVEQVRQFGLIDFKKTAMTEKMPKDVEAHKAASRQISVIKRNIDDLHQKITQLYDFENTDV